MRFAAAAFALLAGLLHVAIFYLESVAWTSVRTGHDSSIEHLPVDRAPETVPALLHP